MGLGSLWGRTPPNATAHECTSLFYLASRAPGAVEALEMALGFTLSLRLCGGNVPDDPRRPGRRRQNEEPCTFLAAL